MIRQGILIPVYNHGKTVGGIVEQLKALNIPLILVDDGSDAETKAALKTVAAAYPSVTLVTLPRNRGKGGAVMAGIDAAHEMELTHVLQMDADGQHDIGRVPFFLSESRAHPDALICGYPEYDESAPVSRVGGRKISNTWAKIVTLSSALVDVLCGFRVYPVEPVRRIIRRHHLDMRMGFDVEILVRLHWARVPCAFYPVRVSYPVDGISHFHVVRDNIRISWVFTRLFFGMLVRLPVLLLRRKKKG